ncbi:MAG: outer membrane beta-barrel protein [Bacteroidaceae bacterium]|nr:outer membrane beta-barrel protein [Bacteroidaceae bacterium]MBQ9642390.1 outer membrane beta-barrel protein [Bacteroidaceae bacterium]
MYNRIITLCALFLLCVLRVSAGPQDSTATRRSLEVYMKVADHLSHVGIDSLRATLLHAADSTFADTVGVMSHEEWQTHRKVTYAEFKISKPGHYLLKLEADGYTMRLVPIDIPKLYKRELYRELKPIYMKKLPKKNDIVLDEVVVRATKLKFYMDGDTLVYDADAFQMAEGSMLDALIKKLPGVELKSGGEITVNGQKVDALLLNGKDFFDSDRELMLENMPSYMVKNIQSYERVPENVRGTNRENTTQKELVMNVKLKKEYNTGWLANAEAGGGTTFFRNANDRLDGKFLGRLFALRFTDNSRLNLYAMVNNLNDKRTPGEKGEWSPLTQSQGLTTTYNLGGGYFYDKQDQLRYEGSANAKYYDKDDQQHSSSETFLDGGSTFGRSAYHKRSYDVELNTEHRLRLRFQSPFHEKLKFLVTELRPSLNYLRWNNHTESANATLSADVASGLGKAWLDSIMAPSAGELLKQYAINRTLSQTKGVGHWVDSRVNGWLNFAPPHNDFINYFLSYDYRFTDRSEDNYEHYRLDYPSNAAMAADLRNRYNPTFDRTHHFSIDPNINIAFDNKDRHSINLSYHYTYDYQHSTKSLYLLNKLDEWKDMEKNALGTLPSYDEILSTLDADNSTRSKRTVHTHTPSASYQISLSNDSTDSYTYISFNLALPMQHESMDYWQGGQVDTLMSRNTTFLTPSFYFSHNQWKRGRRIFAYYRMSTTAPSMTSLLNIRNTSNPLYITLGNPNLKNTRSHNFNASYRDKFRRTLFNVSTNATITENAVASGYIYNKETGVRTVTPDNVNGNWNFSGSTGIDIPFDQNEHWRLKENVAYGYNHSVDLSGTNQTAVATRSVVGNHSLSNELGLTFRPTDKMEYSAKGNLHYQHSTSDREDFTTLDVFDFDYGLTGQIELPWGFQFSTDLTMYSRRGYSDATMNTNELVWNARLTKRLMHGNLLVQLDGFDLLGNLSNVHRSINAQGKTETFYNVIPSYCLLHIVWRLNKQPKK